MTGRDFKFGFWPFVAVITYKNGCPTEPQISLYVPVRKEIFISVQATAGPESLYVNRAAKIGDYH